VFLEHDVSPLLFCHIPKTAGTSLKTLVAQASGSVAWVYKGELAIGNPNLDFAKSFRAGRRPEIVMGHFSFGGHRLLGIPPRYATILRNPIDRVVSLYRHQTALTMAGGPVSPIIADAIRSGMTLNAFITSQITEMTNNHMCRVIAGILGIGAGDVSIKATTTERMGFVGRQEGVVAYATVLLEQAD